MGSKEVVCVCVLNDRHSTCLHSENICMVEEGKVRLGEAAHA